MLKTNFNPCSKIVQCIPPTANLGHLPIAIPTEESHPFIPAI